MRVTFLSPVLLFVSFVASVWAQGQSTADICNDNACLAEANGGTMPEGEVFRVIAPLGQSAVAPIQQAPRLSALEGKTIAVVGGSFMASVTHAELKRLILEEYPSAKVYVLGEIGILLAQWTCCKAAGD